MTTIRIGAKSKITLPKPLLNAIQLVEGDLLEAQVVGDAIILKPSVNISTVQQREEPQPNKILNRVKSKIERIKNDILNSKGLTAKELEAAVQAKLIPKSQAYYWSEKWQKGERAAERDIRDGNTSGPFHSAEELVSNMKQLLNQK